MIEISEIEEEGTQEKSLPESFISVLIALIFTLLLISQGAFDPTPFNLVNPIGGVANIFGLAGSLFAGFFFDFFGHSIWGLVIGWIFLKRREDRPLVSRILFALILFIAFNHVLANVLSLQGDLVAPFTGLLGHSFSGPVAGLITPWPGLGVSLLFLGLAVPLFQLDFTLFILLGVSGAAVAKLFGALKQKSGPWVSQLGIYVDMTRATFRRKAPVQTEVAPINNLEEDSLQPERPNGTLKQALEAYKNQSFKKNEEL
ncbi:MAG: DNA translocase FtsK 4TM domain-containing protein [SAR324 cluster bacterium]|nr:DNA translocase FtsK 4TM domain-containing protein [SAR324 cluster bacterium]